MGGAQLADNQGRKDSCFICVHQTLYFDMPTASTRGPASTYHVCMCVCVCVCMHACVCVCVRVRWGYFNIFTFVLLLPLLSCCTFLSSVFPFLQCPHSSILMCKHLFYVAIPLFAFLLFWCGVCVCVCVCVCVQTFVHVPFLSFYVHFLYFCLLFLSFAVLLLSFYVLFLSFRWIPLFHLDGFLSFI